MREDLIERLLEAANDSRHQQLLREAAAALEAAREDATDAERYRWWRDNPEHPSLPRHVHGMWLAQILMPYQSPGLWYECRRFWSLDAAIDQARGKK